MNRASLYSQSTNLQIEDYFTLTIIQKKTSTNIVMQVLNQQINTSGIPLIVDLLRIYLPNVLLTQCFNDEELPFLQEVRNTETGHLFEHILLEYLCQLKIAKGHTSAAYQGRTKWNWLKDPRGKFHISLNCGSEEVDILHPAISKTVELMKVVLQNSYSSLIYQKNPRIYRNGLKNGKRIRHKSIKLKAF